MTKSTRSKEQPSCPCGSPRYDTCCGRLHRGEAVAETAQALMKSRYSAYVLNLHAYLLETWHVSRRPAADSLSADAAQTRWLGLDVKRHQLIDEDHAIVEFVARYRPGSGGRAERLHETSRFARENGRWFYVDGDIHPA